VAGGQITWGLVHRLLGSCQEVWVEKGHAWLAI
jgi:hypothetical protein